MTTDSLFTGVLTLSLLAAGSLAFGHDLVTSQAKPAEARVVMLPMVTVIGHRQPAPVLVARQAVPVRVASL